MIQRIVRVHPRAALLAVVAGLLLVPMQVRAEPVPGEQDRLVVRLVCEFLSRGHLSRPKIDDELSRRLFSRYLKEIDPTKLYFLKGDIDEFKQDETALDAQLLKGD